MKKKIFFLGLGVPSLILLPSHYYLESTKDSVYIPGSINRGIRVVYNAAKVTFKYLYYGINNDSHEYSAKIMSECFRKNGGCYVKLGQAISQSEHLIPDPYIRHMEPLMQANTKSDFKSVKKFLESVYKRKLDEVFDEFETEPLGTASLAQVHKAKLKDGTVVAVKIQHSYVAKQSKGDIVLCKIFCFLSEKIFKEFKFRWIGREFEINLPKELNFLFEGRNAEKLRELLKEDDRLVIPKIFWEYSSEKVLVMSYEEGASITNINYMRQNKIDIKETATILSELFYKQIFQLGFVHSDPHPGNIFVRKEKVNGKDITKIVLLDHDIITVICGDVKIMIKPAVYTQNIQLLEKSCLELGIKNVSLFVPVLFTKSFEDLFNKDDKFSTDKRFNERKTNDEKLKLRKLAAMHHKEISIILDGVRKEMLLLLKINEFIRAIDRKIGNPINNVELMMKFFTEELIKFEKKNKNYKEVLRIRFENFVFMYVFFVYRAFYLFTSLFSLNSDPTEDKDFCLDLI